MRSETLLRGAVRCQPRPGVIRTNHPASPQPGRQPPSQQRPLAHRDHPDAHRPHHPSLRPTAPGRRKKHPGDHPLPQTAHRPRDLPAPHQPAPNPRLRPAAQPPTQRRSHHHPGRPSPPNTPQPHLSPRNGPRPQPPTRHPIPHLDTQPPTPPPTDLTNIGASSCFPTHRPTSGHVNAIFPVLAILHPMGEAKELGPDTTIGCIIPGQQPYLRLRSIPTSHVHEELGPVASRKLLVAGYGEGVRDVGVGDLGLRGRSRPASGYWLLPATSLPGWHGR